MLKHTHTSTHTSTHTCSYAHIQTHIQAHIHAAIRKNEREGNVLTTDRVPYADTPLAKPDALGQTHHWRSQRHTYLHTFMQPYTRIQAHTRTYKNTCKHTFAHIHAHMLTYKYTCTRAYKPIRTHTCISTNTYIGLATFIRLHG